MAYKKVGWKDYPSTDTPINATNLDHMDAGILENEIGRASCRERV